MRALALCIALTACATGSSLETELRTNLTRDLAERQAGEPVSCVDPMPGRGLQIVDRSTLVYESGDTIFVNRLEAECPSLRPTSTLIVETFGSRYCRGDRVRASEPGSSIPGPYCLLGNFTPYRRR